VVKGLKHLRFMLWCAHGGIPYVKNFHRIYANSTSHFCPDPRIPQASYAPARVLQLMAHLRAVKSIVKADVCANIHVTTVHSNLAKNVDLTLLATANKFVRWTDRSQSPNGISISSAVFARVHPCDQHTDTQTQTTLSVTSAGNRPRLCYKCEATW